MESIDVGPWIGSLMFIVALSVTVATAKYVAHLHRNVRHEIKAKTKG